MAGRKYGYGLKLTASGVVYVDLSEGTTSAVVLSNNGAYGSLDNTGNQRSLIKLTGANDLLIGDQLGPVYVLAGSASTINLATGSTTRLSVSSSDVSLVPRASGAVKVSFGSTEKFRLGNDGGLVVGSAVVGTWLGAVGIGLDTGAPIYHRYGGAWVPSVKLDASGILTLGDAANSQLDLICGTSGSGTKTIRFYRGATKIMELDNPSNANETALQLLAKDLGVKRVMFGSSDGVVPGTARVLYVEV